MTLDPGPFWLEDRLFTTLFAVEHTPFALVVVLVPPLLGELVRHHRSYVVLAHELRAHGVPCVMYDHHGTGDSVGALADADTPTWTDDLERVVSWSLEATGAGGAVLVGARLAAGLCIEVSSRMAQIDAIVAWNPVFDGGSFVEDAARVHQRELGPYLQSAPRHAAELLGFDLGEYLLDELNGFRASPTEIPPHVELLIIQDVPRGKGRPSQVTPTARTITVPHPAGWDRPADGIYDVVVARGVIDRIISWILARR